VKDFSSKSWQLISVVPTISMQLRRRQLSEVELLGFGKQCGWSSVANPPNLHIFEYSHAEIRDREEYITRLVRGFITTASKPVDKLE
jgi:hypothetical protein